MNRIVMIVCFVMIGFLSGCKKDDSPKPIVTTFKPTVYPPASITKTSNANVYVHVMPWFETPMTSTDGKWGQHWTMATRDPGKTDPDGNKEIASHFYPQTGPYASSDPDIIEYQLLLMKLSGIDGILIDWYGTQTLFDYPSLLKNVESILKLIDKVGLKYAIVYEDAVMKNVSDDKKIDAAKKDIAYVQSQYFSSSSYVKVDDKPLLLTFGPQTFTKESDWTSIFADLSVKPKFLTLWYQSAQAGANASGEFSWIYQDAQPHLVHLDNFYNKALPTFKMGSAYPGFKDYYTEGGWLDNVNFSISYNDANDDSGDDVKTFTTTLTKALDNVNYIQIATWNDYGEGTMIEPTIQFKYNFLTAIQQSLGVELTQSHLEMVYRLYKLRKVTFSSTDKSKLDQVFYDLVSLRFQDADDLMTKMGG